MLPRTDEASIACVTHPDGPHEYIVRAYTQEQLEDRIARVRRDNPMTYIRFTKPYIEDGEFRSRGFGTEFAA